MGEYDFEGRASKRLATVFDLIDAEGHAVAQYSGAIVLGNPDEAHIELSPDYGLGFYQGTKIEQDGVPTNRVAYIQEDRLFIRSATLTDSLRIGNFRWVVMEHRISLKYDPV